MFCKPVHVVICFIVIQCVLSAPINVGLPKQNIQYKNQDQQLKHQMEALDIQDGGKTSLDDGGQLSSSSVQQNDEEPTSLYSDHQPSYAPDVQEPTTEAVQEMLVINEDNTHDYIDINNDEAVNVIHKDGNIPALSNSEKLPNTFNSEMALDYNMANNLDYSDINNFLEDYPSVFADYLGYGNSLSPLGDVGFENNYWDDHQPNGGGGRAWQAEYSDDHQQNGGVGRAWQTEYSDDHQQNGGGGRAWQAEYSDVSQPSHKLNPIPGQPQNHKGDLSYQEPPTFVREDFEGEDVEGPEVEQMLAMVAAREHPGLSNGIEYDVGVADGMAHSPGVLHEAAEMAKQRSYAQTGGIPDEEELEIIKRLVHKYGRGVLDET